MKKTIFMILVAILIAGVSGGGVYFWQKSILDKEKAILTIELNDLKRQKSNIENTTNSASKSYAIAEYGLKIQFPNNWIEAQETNPGTIEFRLINRNASEVLGSDLKIYKLDKPEGQTLQQYFDNLHDSTCAKATTPLGCAPKFDVSKWENIKIDGKDAVFSGLSQIYGGKEYYIYIDFERYFLVFRGLDLGTLNNFEQSFTDIVKTTVFEK